MSLESVVWWGDSQNMMPPPTIKNQHSATKKGPAAPVIQSANASTRLKHRMTSPDSGRIKLGMSADHKNGCEK